MLREKTTLELSDFLKYLAAHDEMEDGLSPSLTDLSAELGVSIAGLREQLEVARGLGLVEVKPRVGIRRLPYSFLPAVRLSLGYAIEEDEKYFQLFADLRIHTEEAYWHEAVKKLTPDDLDRLQTIISKAWSKLKGSPVQIPHEEHKRLHLTIYCRLENPFVCGILDAYWEAYEAIGLNVFTDYNYLNEVWNYHEKMVEAIRRKEYDAGYQALVEHTDLLSELIHHHPGK
jgi:DNA-binding FadR family transcriptional regulator